ncbi:calumenin-B-like [Tubulanus polymorphus]|uniref:calumenin-B-like n=1 Tax=Tubulanus polymorphus TaxID=672921 RepID=UPI003DA60BBA
MLKFYIIAAFLGLTLAEPAEYTAHLREEEQGHHAEFDHLAILGNRKEAAEFATITPDDAQRRLAILVEKMDQNADGVLTQVELIQWISENYRKLDRDAANVQFATADVNGDGFAAWDEYLDKAHHTTPEKIEATRKAGDEEFIEFVQSMDHDMRKFHAADANEDGKLDRKEYAEFTNPTPHGKVLEVEALHAMEKVDKNRDGYVEEHEYIGNLKPDGDDAELYKEMVKHFKEADKNGDGLLDKLEYTGSMVFDYNDAATLEAKHLILKSDTNKDGELSKDEVVAAHAMFVGSAKAINPEDLRDEL